jgi:hypothetical protein
LSADSVRAALLSKGYFPKELPPTFTTETFGQAAGPIISDWEAAALFTKQQKKKNRNKYKSKSYGYEIPKAEMEIISTPKIGFERRNIGITHPIPQALLAKEIADNYPAVQKWLCRQTYSLDEIRVSGTYSRAIKGINFALHRAKKAYIEATSDWLVKTDITRFYPSIYTHSITWAAYGKEKVKAKLKLFEGSLADRLDILVRACNRNQTVGIPIGPETSRILAEIVSSRIDDDLVPALSGVPLHAVDRLQDDWFIGMGTLEASEKVLSHVVRAYREYGLDINGSKTSVTRVIKHLEEAWKSEIGGFLSHRSGDLRGGRLREFLALTLRLQSENEKQAVTNYSLTVLEGQKFLKTDVEAMESFLLKSAIIAPGSMSRISELLLNLDFDTGSLSKKRIGPRFTELAVRALEKGDVYEAIWLIYTLRGLNIPIADRGLFELAGETRSSAIALILLDMRARGSINGKLPIAVWEARIDAETNLTDWSWLLAYEGCRRGWLADPTGLMTQPFFAAMKSRDVIFYDERRNVRKRTAMVKLRRALRRRFQREVREFLFAVRDVEFESDY